MQVQRTFQSLMRIRMHAYSDKKVFNFASIAVKSTKKAQRFAPFERYPPFSVTSFHLMHCYVNLFYSTSEIMNDCYLISKQYRTFTGLVWQVL